VGFHRGLVKAKHLSSLDSVCFLAHLHLLQQDSAFEFPVERIFYKGLAIPLNVSGIARMELHAQQLIERNLRLEQDLANRFAPRALTMEQARLLQIESSELKGKQFQIWTVPDWESSRFADAFRRLFVKAGLTPGEIEVVNGAAIGIGILTPVRETIPPDAKLMATALSRAKVQYYTLASDKIDPGKFALVFGQKPTGALDRKPEF
jgi:hypothetical protein